MQLTSPISCSQDLIGELGLQSTDVGAGAGDCFFRSVSHQSYGNSNHQMCIRTAGVQFMRDNPERFIESNTKTSWLRIIICLFKVHGLMHLSFKQLQMY